MAPVVFSCCSRRVPAALTLARDPTRHRCWPGPRDRRPRVVGPPEAGPSRSASVRSQPARAAPVRVGHAGAPPPIGARAGHRTSTRAARTAVSPGLRDAAGTAAVERGRLARVPLLARLSSLSRLPRRVATASVLCSSCCCVAPAAHRRAPTPSRSGSGRCSPRRRWSAASTRRTHRGAAGHRGVDLLGRAGPAGARGAAGHGHLRRRDRRSRCRGRRPRRHAHHLRAGGGLGRARRAGRAPARSSAGSAPGGSHCPPQACLHWGWLRGTTYLDPLLLVGAGPVRLLPLGSGGPAYAGWRPRLPAYAGLGFGALTPAGAPAGRPGAAGRW